MPKLVEEELRQPLRGAPEMQLLGHGEKVAQMAEFQGAVGNRFNRHCESSKSILELDTN